jgi:hypothetical protein
VTTGVVAAVTRTTVVATSSVAGWPGGRRTPQHRAGGPDGDGQGQCYPPPRARSRAGRATGSGWTGPPSSDGWRHHRPRAAGRGRDVVRPLRPSARLHGRAHYWGFSGPGRGRGDLAGPTSIVDRARRSSSRLAGAHGRRAAHRRAYDWPSRPTAVPSSCSPERCVTTPTAAPG